LKGTNQNVWKRTFWKQFSDDAEL